MKHWISVVRKYGSRFKVQGSRLGKTHFHCSWCPAWHEGLVWMLGIILLSITGPAWGDVLVESTFKTSGIKGMGEAEGTSTQRYQGVKKWESQTTRFTGAILSRLVGEGGSITITRVDKGVSWAVDTKNHTYQEIPLVPPRMKSEERESKEKKSTARITKSEFTVKKTGSAETINGFPCE